LVQLESELEQEPLFEDPGLDVRVTDGTQEDGVERFNSSRTPGGRISPV